MPDILARAAAGDRAAFGDLVAPHRAELRTHCYRMLGSLADAEDALQETLLAAWVGVAGFEGRSSVRTWLFRIATNRCLNALRASSRRPAAASDVLWLTPYPDLLDLPDTAPGPEARYDAREAISLAFVTLVQQVPPQQRAVLLLRDVLGYRTGETASLLGLSPDAVAGSLKRARASLRSLRPVSTPVEPELVERFVTAFAGSDVDALLTLMTEDVWLRMPPLPVDYHGREEVRGFLTSIEAHRRRVRLVPARANASPAWGEYVADPSGRWHVTGVLVAGLDGARIHDLVHFESALAPSLGLPRVLSS